MNITAQTSMNLLIFCLTRFFAVIEPAPYQLKDRQGGAENTKGLGQFPCQSTLALKDISHAAPVDGQTPKRMNGLVSLQITDSGLLKT